MITTIIVIVAIPSLFSAIAMVRDTNFERNVEAFVRENRLVSRSYISDYRIYKDHGRKVEIFLTGEPMTYETQMDLYASAESHRIAADQLVIKEHTLGMTGEEMNEMVREIYDRTDRILSEKENQLNELQTKVDSLTRRVESLVMNPNITIAPPAD
jgi:hypothetical protein